LPAAVYGLSLVMPALMWLVPGRRGERALDDT
jgi:hypothetical protein